MLNDYSEVIRQFYYKEDPLATCRDITFQVTEDCCLKCSYCYQINKTHKMMTKEVAKKGIDLLFKMYDENKEEAYINHHTKGIVLSLIGGEPFMNIEVVEYLTQYFLNTCIKKNHIWLTNSRILITSNGMLYFDPKIQEYLKKYKDLISLDITLDGPKELHDSCRKDFNNNGSFDIAFKAWKDSQKYNTICTTKVTIAPENLLLLDKIFEFFIKEGCNQINANPIFEHNWTIEEAQLYYKKLIILADTLLKHPVENNLFVNHIGKPMLSTDNCNWCGGTGAMLAFDPEGKAYPCLRYMPTSLGDTRAPIIIGDVNSIYKNKDIYNNLNCVTRRSQSTDECFNCHIAQGCAWCSAWNYQETGSYNKRSTNICWMHRARVLANVYYWNNYYIKNHIDKNFILYLDRNIATFIINNEEYDKLLSLSLRG